MPAQKSIPPKGASSKKQAIELPPCPVCGKPSTLEMRPFCSKRCADVDLHRWLSDRYAIPATPDEEERSELPQKDALDE